MMPRGARANPVTRSQDEVYRELYRLEAHRLGAEMGLALALLRAWVAAGFPAEDCRDWEWLRAITPLGLQMIESSLDSIRTKCNDIDGC